MTTKKQWRVMMVLLTVASVLTMLLSGCSQSPETIQSEPTTTGQTQNTDATQSTNNDETEQSSTTSQTAKSGSTTASSVSTKKPATTTTVKATSATTASDKLAVDVYNAASASGKLAVWFFSMPSTSEHTGDCTLVRTPSGKTMLIDTGSANGGKQVCNYLDKLGIKKIDVLVITHMHQDHVGGAVNILRHVTVGKVYGTPLKDYQTSGSRSFISELRNRNITYNVLKKGDIITLDSDVKLETLWPNADFSIPDGVTPEEDGGFTNNSSAVLRLQYDQRTFLFTGDIEMEVESELIANLPQKLKCDVVKIPHHGAATSSSMDFVRALGAKYGTIITYAFNDINVLQRYKSLNVNVQITSVTGTVMYVTNGKTLQYATEK